MFQASLRAPSWVADGTPGDLKLPDSQSLRPAQRNLYGQTHLLFQTLPILLRVGFSNSSFVLLDQPKEGDKATDPIPTTTGSWFYPNTTSQWPASEPEDQCESGRDAASAVNRVGLTDSRSCTNLKQPHISLWNLFATRTRHRSVGQRCAP